jgi:hypothetical protein
MRVQGWQRRCVRRSCTVMTSRNETRRSSARAAPLVCALYTFQLLSAPRGPPGTSNDAGRPPLREATHDKEQHSRVLKRYSLDRFAVAVHPTSSAPLLLVTTPVGKVGEVVSGPTRRQVDGSEERRR